MRSFTRSLFIDSAEILSGHFVDDQENAISFLRDIGYLEVATESGHDPSIDVRINILRNAAKMDLFVLDVPNAPEVVFIGGRVLPDSYVGYSGFQASSASGISLSLQSAFESCVGEAVEYLSQLSPPQASITEELKKTDFAAGNHNCLDRWLCYHTIQKQNNFTKEWLLGKNLIKEDKCLVPNELCLRQKARLNTHGLSTGCAAGESLNAATASAILELVERDAAALWWEGGRSPRPISNEALLDAEIETLFKHSGRSGKNKITLILDITTDIDIPCIAAISTDAKTGGSFSCGLASRVTFKEAIRKAVYEMMQMELSHHLIGIKCRLHGVEALNGQEKAQIKRNESLGDLWNLPMIRSIGAPGVAESRLAGAGTDIQWVLERLSLAGLDATRVNLTRELFGIPVVKVLIPELQTYPLASTTMRLKNMISDTGGGRQYTKGVSLL